MSVELKIQDRSFEFAVRVVNLCKTQDQTPGVSRALANQLLRSGTSVGANIAEAQAGQSKKDFIAKMAIAAKEARESFYWLKLLTASNIIPEAQLTNIKDESNQIIAILTSIIKIAQRNVINNV